MCIWLGSDMVSRILFDLIPTARGKDGGDSDGLVEKIARSVYQNFHQNFPKRAEWWLYPAFRSALISSGGVPNPKFRPDEDVRRWVRL